MSLFDWFANRRKSVPNSQERPEREIADGLWNKCTACDALSYTKDLRANQMVCLECGHHIRVYSDDRIEQLIDPNTWVPINGGLHATDPLKFRDRKKYSDRLREFQEKTGHLDAVETGTGQLENLPVALGVMEFQFIGGSMGSVVGEKLTRLIEHATRERLPVIIVCASGGARMQEGMLSLMQMAKISGALERHREARLLYIPILTHPTTGGVTASFAMLGDIIIAEPKATVAFTGGRVIEQTLREKLPENYQTSEYSFAHGFVDLIVPRTQLKKTIAQLIGLHQKEPFLANSEFPAVHASDSHHAVAAPTHAFKLSP